MSYAGAKLMLFLGSDLLVIRRDDTPGIPWPNCLDFPGGGREGTERPEECALRETREETGLDLPETALAWRQQHGPSWFFAAHLPPEAASRVVFGGEGRGWGLMAPDIYLERDDAIPHFRQMLDAYLGSRG
ncbi:DNA mismatch repair protein MutT [Salipiger aestuarii]|nr:NUDIX hydrolase [Salipiger aestuarii]KAA8607998.1 DNA mismatch repair protein MutT [Salipiger aestuarii]KAA8611391.1 DNA mismatch repair protein MutT [Salipiger aestuarii]